MPATDSFINLFALERTARDSAEHTAPPLGDRTISYKASDDVTKLSFSALHRQLCPVFSMYFVPHKELPSLQRLHLLSQHGLEPLAGLTKIRSEESGVSKHKLFNPMPPPSEPISFENFLPTGSAGYERFPKALQIRTKAHQPGSKKNILAAAKRLEAQSLALVEEFPDKISETLAKHMRREACDTTFVSNLGSESSHIEFSTTSSNACHHTNDKEPAISSVQKSVGKWCANAALIERSQLQKLSSIILY